MGGIVTTLNEARSRAGKRGGASLVDTYGVDHMRRIGRAGAKRGGRPTYGEAMAWAKAEGHVTKLSRATVKRLLAESCCPNCLKPFNEADASLDPIQT